MCEEIIMEHEFFILENEEILNESKWFLRKNISKKNNIAPYTIGAERGEYV